MDVIKGSLARTIVPVLSAACVALSLGPSALAQPAPASKPNILVIMSDDIGYWNISAYNRGMMGYHSNS